MRADFLNTRVDPKAAHGKKALKIEPDSPQRFFNRELSWLAFNWRVLEEAENPRQPLLERVRFLSISASNLDEFYMVRVAGLRGLVRQGVKARSIDGRTPAEQLREIEADARALMAKQQELWSLLRKLLAKEGVEILRADKLTDADRAYLDKHFLNQVFPVLTPLAIDPAHPFPFIPNKGFALALQLKSTSGGDGLEALIPIPSQVDRYIALPVEGPIPVEIGPSGAPIERPPLRYCALETLIDLYLDRLFPGYTVSSKALFRILRDSDIEIEEEAEDLVAMFESALKRRRRGEVIRLKIAAGAPKKLARRLIRQLEVEDDEVIEVEG
ncbi:MAG: RNA degradosome polyphosphate kinase, partial [Pseudomonadota bacterium]